MEYTRETCGGGDRRGGKVAKRKEESKKHESFAKHLPHRTFGGTAALLDGIASPLLVDFLNVLGVDDTRAERGSLGGPHLAAVHEHTAGECKEEEGLEDAVGVPLEVWLHKRDGAVVERVAEQLMLYRKNNSKQKERNELPSMRNNKTQTSCNFAVQFDRQTTDGKQKATQRQRAKDKGKRI